MSPIWVAVLVVVAASVVLLVRAAWRLHGRIAPTIDAFEAFRGAVGPSVVALRVETDATRRRIAAADAELRERT